jgi:hypothetical protein
VGDWSSFALTMSAGSGEIVTKDRVHFAAVEMVNDGVTRIDVTLPSGPGECQTISLVVSNIERDAQGLGTVFSGTATGRCCGTISVSYRMTKSVVRL